MNRKDLVKKIRKNEFILNKINATKLDIKPKGNSLNISLKTNYDIVENTGTNLVIKAISLVSMDPEVLFSIDVEHTCQFKLNEKLTNEEIDDNIEILLAPLGSEVSFLVSFITKKMSGNYIILPPVLKIEPK